MFKRDILDYLRTKYYDEESRTHEFGRTSCEDLCHEIMQKFNCSYVCVMEDDENGAEVIK